MIIVIIRFFLYFVKFKRCQYLENIYTLNVYNQDCKKNILEYKYEISQLFKNANIKDVYLPYMDRIGAMVSTGKLSVIDNVGCDREDIVNITLGMFKSSIGYYRTNAFNSFNPMYWIDLIIFLPKHILLYFEVSKNKNIFKIFNILLSIIWWGFNLIIILFGKEELINSILKFIN